MAGNKKVSLIFILFTFYSILGQKTSTEKNWGASSIFFLNVKYWDQN